MWKNRKTDEKRLKHDRRTSLVNTSSVVYPT